MNQNNNTSGADIGSDALGSVRKKNAHLSVEDIRRILALPRRKLRVNGTIQETIIDEEGGYIYFPNPNAKSESDALLPNRVPWKADMQPKQQETSTQGAGRAEPLEKQLPLDKDDATKNQENEKSLVATESSSASIKKNKWKVPLMISAVSIAAIIVLSIPVLKDYLPIDTGLSSDVSVKDTVSIVQVVRPLIPGDKIEEDDIQEAVIRTETYNQITLQGTNLYAWQRADTLVGMYVQEYVPAGQYVSFASVGAAYDSPLSLWASDSYIDIPLTADQADSKWFLPGEQVDLTIRKQIASEKPEAGSEKKLSGNGTQKTIKQSVTITETNLKSAVICDVLSGDDGKISMYQTLSQLSAIPAGEQADYIRNATKNNEFKDLFSQKYLRIYVSAADLASIGDVEDEKITQITIKPTEAYEKNSDEKSAFIATAQATLHNVDAALSQDDIEKE